VIVSLLGAQLKYPVVTRWNSLYDSIKNVLLHKSKLNELCQKLGIESFLEIDFKYLADYVQLLQPLADAIDFLQTSVGMLFGYLLPALATIKTKLTKIQINSESEHTRWMAGALMSAVNERFSAYVNLEKNAEDAVIASILCPAVKCRWIKAINPELEANAELEAVKLAKNAVMAMSNIEGNASSSTDGIVANYFDFSIEGTFSNCNENFILCVRRFPKKNKLFFQ